jgi:hypothetical protein
MCAACSSFLFRPASLLHFKVRGTAKDDSGAAALAALPKAAPGAQTLIQHRKQHKQVQQPSLPQQLDRRQLPPASDVFNTAASAPLTAHDVAASAASAASVTAAMSKGEYSDSSFIYDDNSGSDGEQISKHLAGSAAAHNAAAMSSDFIGEEDDMDGLIAAAVSTCTCAARPAYF